MENTVIKSFTFFTNYVGQEVASDMTNHLQLANRLNMVTNHCLKFVMHCLKA